MSSSFAAHECALDEPEGLWLSNPIGVDGQPSIDVQLLSARERERSERVSLATSAKAFAVKTKQRTATKPEQRGLAWPGHLTSFHLMSRWSFTSLTPGRSDDAYSRPKNVLPRSVRVQARAGSRRQGRASQGAESEAGSGGAGSGQRRPEAHVSSPRFSRRCFAVKPGRGHGSACGPPQRVQKRPGSSSRASGGISPAARRRMCERGDAKARPLGKKSGGRAPSGCHDGRWYRGLASFAGPPRSVVLASARLLAPPLPCTPSGRPDAVRFAPFGTCRGSGFPRLLPRPFMELRTKSSSARDGASPRASYVIEASCVIPTCT